MSTRCIAPVLALTMLAPSLAFAQSPDAKRECVASYESAQRLRRDGRMLDAKRSLVACVQESCPPVLRQDCAGWLKEVEAAIPTIVLEARGADGLARIDVEVSADGALVASRLDGRAIELDPGLHAFRFRFDETHVVERSVVVREGEKSQKIVATLEAPIPPPPPSAPPMPLPPRDEGTPARASSRPWPLTIALGGVGVLALGSFAFFGLSGRAEEHDTLEACRPSCPHDEVRAVGTKYLVADVSLVVGVLALGAAVVVWLAQGPRASSPTPAR